MASFDPCIRIWTPHKGTRLGCCIFVFCGVVVDVILIVLITKFRFISILWNFIVASCCDQGILTNETRCLQCETVTARDETFFDLSLDIEQNSSITSCLKNFSSTETLNAEDKFFCDKCCRYMLLYCGISCYLGS